jgi:hypothetical protein
VKQVTAARKMIRGLQVKPEHEALKAMVLGLAEAVDSDPKNAALWRELRAAVTTLREATENNSDDDSATFLFSIKTPRVSSKMGDT